MIERNLASFSYSSFYARQARFVSIRYTSNGGMATEQGSGNALGRRSRMYE
jgi:hypothetical protein